NSPGVISLPGEKHRHRPRVMKYTKVPRTLLLLLAALLCLFPCARALGATDDVETARQVAASADDGAVGLEERQESLKTLEEAARLFLGAGETLEAARALNRAGR